MEIRINLLPEEKKNKIKRKKGIVAIIKQEVLFLSAILFLIVILFDINFILKLQLDSLEKNYSLEQSQNKYQELKRYEDKFKEINSKTAMLDNIEKDHLYWSKLFYELDKVVPDGILINNISNNGYRMSLTGTSAKRENLLKFQDNINASQCFSDVNVPLSNLVSKENVNFKIDFKIREDCLKLTQQ
jgi:Tfp pilus assembly protein PilN